MKRVLQISNYFYPNRGGIEQVARDIAKALNGTCEQKIICFNETAEDGDKKTKREETATDIIDDVEIIRCGCITKQASQSISLTFRKQLNKVLKDFRPDIIIFHYPNPFQAFFLLKQLKQYSNCRLILYWHLDITKQKILGKLFHRQTIRLLNFADTVVATSPVYINGSHYLSKYRNKCTVIPNCIDTERLLVTETIKRKAEEIRKKNQTKILCFAIGRHIPYKGFTYLIQAAKYLDDRFYIIVAGSGPLTNQLKQEAKDNTRITFPGRISDDELIAYYLAMDIFCFPSITKNEAFGLALAEAMSFNKPAVTFTIPGSGVNYVNIDKETGLEVPNGDAKAYAEALILLANDSELRQKLGNKSAERVRELFYPDVFRIKILNLLFPNELFSDERREETH